MPGTRVSQKLGSVVVSLVLGPARSLSFQGLIGRLGHRGHLVLWELVGARVGQGPEFLGAHWEPGAMEATGASRPIGSLEPAVTGASRAEVPRSLYHVGATCSHGSWLELG